MPMTANHHQILHPEARSWVYDKPQKAQRPLIHGEFGGWYASCSKAAGPKILEKSTAVIVRDWEVHEANVRSHPRKDRYV